MRVLPLLPFCAALLFPIRIEPFGCGDLGREQCFQSGLRGFWKAGKRGFIAPTGRVSFFAFLVSVFERGDLICSTPLFVCLSHSASYPVFSFFWFEWWMRNWHLIYLSFR